VWTKLLRPCHGDMAEENVSVAGNEDEDVGVNADDGIDDQKDGSQVEA
jgi:hypothetical protein